MSNVINLNRVRKARAAAGKVAEAAANRIRFGRTKAETDRNRKIVDKTTSEFAGKLLDFDR